jgi:L-ascorbate metabolism protein UlaG (beta-lactamase superfamily)
MRAAVILTLIGILAGLIFLGQAMFGATPSGSRLARIGQSPHYAQGQFKNLEESPILTGDQGFWADLRDDLFAKDGTRPKSPVPSVKTDMRALDRRRDFVIWLGHSSYYIQLGGKTILVDPVFSAYASPIFFANKAFPGSSPFTADDLPNVDFLLISHDHWDHLDYPTVLALRSKIKTIVAPLGVGAHFARWGFPDEAIFEGDWNEAFRFENLTVHVLPARHFSGRSLWDNKTLWGAFALVSSERQIFLSGDTGYGKHFAKIGEQFGGFDLVSLDAGQYDQNWPYMHMTPEEAAQAAEDLRADSFIPGHVGKFALANHEWDEPLRRISAASQARDYQLLTPRIGEVVYLETKNPGCPLGAEARQ